MFTSIEENMLWIIDNTLCSYNAINVLIDDNYYYRMLFPYHMLNHVNKGYIIIPARCMCQREQVLLNECLCIHKADN